MKLKKRIKAFEIIKSGIHAIDPYALLKGGAPDDEFDSEINSILNQLDRCNNAVDLAHIMARVLSFAFSESFDYKLYIPFANDMFESLKINNVLK